MSNLLGCDYTCQRKQNIEKLRELYNTELQKYNREYNTFLEYKYSGNTQKENTATNIIQPKIVAINTTLNNILSELKKNIQYTDKLINKQRKIIEIKNAKISEKNQLLNNQDTYVLKK